MNHLSVVAFLLLIFGTSMMVLGFGLVGIATLYASVAVMFGAALLIASFRCSRQWIIRDPSSGSTLPALYIAVEFIAGSYLIFLGIVNQLLDLGMFDVGLTLVSVLGVALVVDSLLLYRRGFKQISA